MELIMKDNDDVFNFEVSDLEKDGFSSSGLVTITYSVRHWCHGGNCSTDEQRKKSLIDSARYWLNEKILKENT